MQRGVASRPVLLGKGPFDGRMAPTDRRWAAFFDFTLRIFSCLLLLDYRYTLQSRFLHLELRHCANPSSFGSNR